MISSRYEMSRLFHDTNAFKIIKIYHSIINRGALMNRSTQEQDTPSITVLMSVYNGARWLSESIKSVLDQTFRDFEFIIVDDGSTDNSVEILELFKAQDRRIIIISKPNTGLADSLNQGIQKARGDWIARLDADDICEITRFEKQIERARSNSKLVFIGTGLTIINEFGTKEKIYSYPSQHEFLLRNLITARKFPAHSSSFYLTQVIRDLGGYRSRVKLSEDIDLWLRLSEVGELTSLSEPLVQLRRHSEQISHDDAGKRQLFDSIIAIVSYWIRKLGGTDPVDADETSFLTFIAWLQTRLNKDGFFESHAHFAQCRSLIREDVKSFRVIRKLLESCFLHPVFTALFIKNKIWGEMLTHQLALDWLHQK